MKVGWFHEEHIVDFDYMKQYATLPTREDVLVIDSRPAKMYGPYHLPTAVMMPDSQFDEMAAEVLPENKDTLLIFYCGGYT